MTDHDDIEPPHASSPTDHVLSELQLFGYRPFDDQPDPRPLPEGKMIAGAVADIFDALVATLNDTRLEPDLEDLLWSTVNLFHRAADRIESRARRQRAGATQKPARAERLGSAIGRTGAPDGRRHHADRTPQLPRALPRSGRRALRGPHRFDPGAPDRDHLSTTARSPRQ